MASVKVAVRVRPLNKREKDMDCKVCIKMSDKKTTIQNPNSSADIKDFSYDHSYWSVDSRDKHFATQEQVFSNLGTDVITSAFDGYNACIFAYGQTGAGKSYTMMGMQEAFGLIPRICEGMYERMAHDQVDSNNKVEFKTEVSYLEIYNERVRDLLRPAPKKGDAFNLKVREHPKDGPYVQDLTKHLVSKYADIEKLMDVGNEHRTTASTSMNDTSSRSHAIFTLNFTQAKFFTDMPSETVSKIHLVDLAGSERANSTGATGQRLKEGANINKSLVTLGSVISALAELSNQDNKKKTFIPYRDSVLTWLLKDSLGGNAKTIMIAAISPADVNYHETLSTLRYANRAKNIINKPTVNEDPNVKLIRELRDEIENLRSLLQTSNVGHHLNVAEESKVTERLHENEAKVEQLTRDWNKKWQETQKIMEEAALAFRREGFGIKMESDLPHLICVDDDILSTGITMYHLSDGRTYVGREHGQVKQDLILHGPGIEASHCIIESIEGSVTIHPIAPDCYVNGHKINKPTRLTQGAVLLLGKTNMFRFNHPAEAAKLRQKYASVENLASMVPARQAEAEAPSYLFYNAGLAMERRYREEARMLDEKRKEIERKQQEDLKKLEEAKQQLEELHTQKKAEEESQRKELETTQKLLEEEKRNLLAVKTEQENSRERVRQELHDLKSRILLEQDEEKRKLDEEMTRLLSLKEEHQETVKFKEEEFEKQHQEIVQQRETERQELERQKVEVERLQAEFETSRAAASQDRSPTPNEEERIAADESSDNAEEKRPTATELRKKLQVLEETYEGAVKVAQKEIMQAKDALKQAEMATLQGKVGLSEGKMALQVQWKKLDSLQSKHKKTQDDIQVEICALKELLEKVELDEENSLLQRKKSILDRKRARKRVEEATQKLAVMERSMSMGDTDGRTNKEMLEWQNKEEVRELADQRKILMELLSKHQVALVKASQMVTETKTKLENHLENEKILIDPIRQTIATLERELEPLNMLESQIDRRAETYEKEMREKKKMLYKQRKRIALLEKQHAQTTNETTGLTTEELEDSQNDRDSEVELILKEKSILKEMESKYKEIQDETELQISEATRELERRKGKLGVSLVAEKDKLQQVQSVHQETTEFIEAELQAREEMLKRVKDKVVHDKRELAKLDMKHQQTASKAAEELFMMAEILEKELGESGKKDELSKIRDHRRKLQELDRQLRLAERKEKFTTKDGEDPQQCVLL